MSKESEIKTELKALEQIFKNIPENQKKLCANLMQNAAFMSVALRDLQKEVLEKGATVISAGGNGYEIAKDNPAQRAYTAMIGKYATVINQLQGLLPDAKETATTSAGESLAVFVGTSKHK